MQNQKNFRTYNISLLAGIEANFDIDGTMYHVVNSDGQFIIVFDESNRITNAESGTGAQFNGGYRRVKILSDIDQNVVLVMGHGEYKDSRAKLSGSVPATLTPSEKTVGLAQKVCAAGVRTKIANTNLKRRELRLCIPSDQNGGLYLGNSSIVAGQGGYIDVGVIDYLSTTSELYVFNSNAFDVVITLLDLEVL